MKGIRLLFAACIAPLLMTTAVSFAATTSSRGTPRRSVSATAPQSATSRERAPVSSRRAATSAVTSRTTTTTPIRERNVTTSSRGVSARTVTPPQATSARTTTTPTRTTRAAATTSRSAVTPRASAARPSATRSTNRGRSATTQTITRDDIMARDATKCRTIFYECMDEFCANKDAQLKRCACSTRINEFRGLQENLDLVEDKLLDFGQRLLTVSMDKEDAAVLNQATAGELAFNQDDRSESKKQLDEIAKKLNTSFDNSNFDQNLNAISLSLNIDAAFDSIDSMAGASTTTKSGTALYSAALPVCREMALEVCSPEELTIAEGGYQMLIEQDCNTVKKSFQTQSDQARAKVFENSALLDMSRLDIHQQRNSDDILTCKSKMLDMLTNSTVCGTDMINCLDTSGQYINPTTGTAILSVNLANLSTLITRPTSGNETWTSISSNSRYVTFLNSKKKFLEPAMENCQDIADVVWQEFLGDALAQIKLAQDAKLEQIRQSCTTLTTQCLDTALTNITEFDERALSIFGVTANKTATAMCASVNQACTALFRANESADGTDQKNDWKDGIDEIALSKTYETLISTCREVGRNCITQNCSAGSDQFGLCNDIYSSTNRHLILERQLCWDEVKSCIAEAGDETITQIMTNIYFNGKTQTEKYTEWYGDATNIQDICNPDCNTNKCYEICRLSEMIWGNCTTQDKGTSKIALNIKNGTPTTELNETSLLAWMAHQTTTSLSDDSCSASHCPAGYIKTANGCMNQANLADDEIACQGKNYHFNATENDTTIHTNCCATQYRAARYQSKGSAATSPQSTTCCATEGSNSAASVSFSGDTLNNMTNFSNNLFYRKISVSSSGEINYDPVSFPTNYSSKLHICAQPAVPMRQGTTIPSTPLMSITIGNTDGNTEFVLLCNKEDTGTSVTADANNAANVKCPGKYVLSTADGILIDPYALFDTEKTVDVYSYFYPETGDKGSCIYKCTLNNNQSPTQASNSGTISLSGSCGWFRGESKCDEQPIGWSTIYTGRYL